MRFADDFTNDTKEGLMIKQCESLTTANPIQIFYNFFPATATVSLRK